MLCSSEAYVRRIDAAVNLVKSGTVRYEIVASVNRQWFFRILAINGRVLGHSETYRNRADAHGAADLVRRWAPAAPDTALAS